MSEYSISEWFVKTEARYIDLVLILSLFITSFVVRLILDKNPTLIDQLSLSLPVNVAYIFLFLTHFTNREITFLDDLFSFLMHLQGRRIK
ncbi:hypothetical protein EHQ58_10340 [Leptospira ognonensis]|uniref:Uncharacterized protein n=1 Tax=Leptospira ognonensis TaxID=2484945 RepID=A0A4R9K0I8_9LEPT|nr:hypothetical protein [Leptospira ognonensis]TGL58531.1 hypothetical protein EHQ58_10340 [Leptospira ognonensis]